uniref:Glutamate-gated chloride channel n=1 Tax=Panagrolaimus sp. ES5 TaxID=591445 RepID=A0AC34GVQ0_9BILA
MVIFVLSLLIVSCFGDDNLERFQSGDLRLLKILNSNENIHRFRPVEFEENGKAKPAKVDVNIYLRSISHVSEVNMEYQLQITYRQTWKDSRLAWGNLTDEKQPYVILNSDQKIWIPDTFFQNEKNAHRHNIDKPNIMVRVHHDGFVLYSVRLTMTLSCPMNFEYYPMDVQECELRFASYAYTTDDIIYKWKNNNPVQIKTGLLNSLPQFKVTNYSTHECSSSTSTGTYSCLNLRLELNREFGFFLLHLFIPSMALVAVSWVSFFIDPTSVPGRVTLGVTVLLTFHALSSGVNSILPPVSYVKAIDVWIFGCATFILASLIEFAIVTYLYTNQLAKRKPSSPEHQQLLRDNGVDQKIHVSSNRIPIVDHARNAIQKDARVVDRASSKFNPA